MVFDFFGPSMFVTLSVVGSIIGYYKRKEKGDERIINVQILLKASYLFIVGELLNLVIDGGRLEIYHLISWNVITFVAFLTLLIPSIMKLDYRFRLGILIFLVLSYFPLYNLGLQAVKGVGASEMNLFAEDVQNVGVFLFIFLFNPANMTPVYSWLIVPFLVSLVFDKFIHKNITMDPNYKKELKLLGKLGLVFILGSILFGFPLVQGYPGIMDDLLWPASWFQWPFEGGIPQFWLRHTPQYLFFNFGILCLMFSYFGKRELVQQKDFPWQDKLCNFGILSLTGFLASFIGVVIPVQTPFLLFWIIFWPIIIVFIYAFWFWVKKFKATGSFEWLMVVYMLAVKKIIKKQAVNR
jgi:hypothetical protein